MSPNWVALLSIMVQILFDIAMSTIPSISEQIDEQVINNIIDKNFSKLAPTYYSLTSNWLIGAYKVFQNIDKFIILVYLLDRNLIFYRKNGIIIDFDTFFNSSKLEIEKINLSDISRDLQIPKESTRRKISELEKKGVIKKVGKKVFLDRDLIKEVQPGGTLKEVSILLNVFNKILIEEKVTKVYFTTDEIVEAMKKNFSFAAYQFNKFLFAFTNSWRKELKDLETLSIGLIVLLNSVENKDFREKHLNRKLHTKNMNKVDKIGVNAMSLSEITGIPRPTVVRKIHYLIKRNFLNINDKKLITLEMKDQIHKRSLGIQNPIINLLSKFIYRVFNQMKVINSTNIEDKDENFIPGYMRD